MQRLRWLALLGLVGCATASPPPSLGEQAADLVRMGSLAQAFTVYRQALCATPSSLDLARQYVETWDHLGQPGNVRARLMCPLAPGVTAYIDGLAAAAAGDTATAEAQLGSAEAAVPIDARGEVAYRRGLAALSGNEPHEALGYLQDAAGLEPGRADIRVAMAQAHFDSKQYGQCVEILRQLLSLKPAPEVIARARHLLHTAVRASQPPLPAGIEQVVDDTLAAVERDQLDSDRLDTILALAKQINNARVLTAAGIAAWRKGLQEDGQQLFQTASALNPLDPDPLRAWGLSLYAAARYTEAIKPLEGAAERDPFDVGVQHMLATAARLNNVDDVARAAYRALTRLEPNVAEHELWLATVDRKLGDLAAAQRAIRRGCALDPHSVPMLVERASIEAQLAHVATTPHERHEAAERSRKAVAQLLRVSPHHPGAASLLNSVKGL